MAVVRNKPTVVVSDTAAGSARSAEVLATALEMCRAQLAEMEAAGKDGGIVKGAPVSEQRSLLEGMRRLEEAESQARTLTLSLSLTLVTLLQVRALVTERAEAKADGASTSGIETKIRSVNAVVENLAPVVGRQQTIKSLWAEATPAWKNKVSEIKEIERQLALL